MKMSRVINSKLHREIKEERGHKCQICNAVPGDICRIGHSDAFIHEPFSLRKRNFDVHHIDRDPWNDDPNNLAILCPRCHNWDGYLHVVKSIWLSSTWQGRAAHGAGRG